MAVRVTEEVVRCSLRFCSHRSHWTLCSVLFSTSIKNPYALSRSADVFGTKQRQTSLHVRSVRFYSQSNNPIEDLEEKELISSPLPNETQSEKTTAKQRHQQSPFRDKLQGCRSPSDVLDLTSEYAPTTGQVSSTLCQMWSTVKMMSEEQRRYELQLMFEHPGFEMLLQRAMKCVGQMHNEDLTYSLLSIVNLGVPQHSRVVQTFLRNCQEKLNVLDEKSLSILASSLEHMESGPNVNALKEGMRLVVEARLPGIKNVIPLQTMMRILGKNAPRELKQKLEKKALSMMNQFTLPNTQHMIFTMAKMDFYSKPILDICSKTITENCHGIPFNRLLHVLISCWELRYKNVDLLTGISEHVTSMFDKWTNKQLLLFLSVYEDLHFCPASLMEAYAEKVIARPEDLVVKDFLCVLKVYSSLNYDLQHRRQQFLDSLSQVLESYLPKMAGFNLLKSVYYLCLLGHFPSAPLEQLLQPSTLDWFNSIPTKFLQKPRRMFQMVDLCLRLDRPPLPCSLIIPPSVLWDPTPLVTPPVNQSLSRGLRIMLGEQAETMLQEMVMEENFYHIDAVITKPLPQQTSPAEVTSCEEEDCSPAERCQRIAVICSPRSGFCYGTSNPRGHLAIKIRHLKLLGYHPVLVSEQELQSVSEEQRSEFLRGQIFPEHHKSDTQYVEQLRP